MSHEKTAVIHLFSVYFIFSNVDFKFEGALLHVFICYLVKAQQIFAFEKLVISTQIPPELQFS